MRESESRIDKIKDVLSYIRERLDELEGEKKELVEYQDLDKKRRALEYTIYANELQECKDALEELEVEREQGAEDVGERHEEVVETQRRVKELEEEIKEMVKEIAMIMREKEYVKKEKEKEIKRKAMLELEMKDAEEKEGVEANQGV